MCDIEKAKALLLEDGYTCVLIKGDAVHTSTERGVKPLLGWLDGGICFKDFSAADKVVGKAAAYLYVLLGVGALYAKIISTEAIKVLEEHRIDVSYETQVKMIRNRDNTGFCPMEQSVIGARSPADALARIKQKLLVL